MKEQENLKNHSDNSENIIKYEKILISFAIVVFALIVGYNAFVVPEMPALVQNSNKVVRVNKNPEKESSSNKTQKSKTYSKSTNAVNINTATKEELVGNLKGVGNEIAERIIIYRETHGGFSSKEELMEVKGVGKKNFKKIKSDIVI